MSIPEVIAAVSICIVLISIMVYMLVDQLKVNRFYRKALETVPQLHSDLVELINTLKEIKNA